MNIYNKLSEKQRKIVEETGDIIEDREYSNEEVKQITNNIATHIFSKSKKEISKEVNKYREILSIIGE